MSRSVFAILMVAATVISYDSYSQFNQGRWLAGGSLAFAANTSKTKDGSTVTTTSKSTSFSLGPDVGYFVIDNLAVGALLTISTSKTTGESVDFTAKSSSVSFGPFVRYYLPASVFFQGTATFGSGNSSYDSNLVDIETKTATMNWGLAVGYAYFLNDFVAIEPMVGYQSNSSRDKDDDVKDIVGSIYLSAAFTIYLGERK